MYILASIVIILKIGLRPDTAKCSLILNKKKKLTNCDYSTG